MQLPMFPLGNVVLPGELLPLNVFEPRYRQLVLDCLAADVAGVRRRAHRTGQRGRWWRRAHVDRHGRPHRPRDAARQRPVRGRRRRASAGSACSSGWPTIRTRAATSRTWPEADAADDDALRPELERLLGRVDETARARPRGRRGRASERVPPRAAPPLKLSDDLVRAAYQLAARAPIGPVDRYRLLAAPTLEARVELLGAALDDTEAMLRFRLA